MATDEKPAPRKGQFVPGIGGNKSGRSKSLTVFRDVCRKAVNGLVVQAWVDEVRNKGPQWAKASELLAAYAYGKPTQSVEVDASVTVARPLIDLGALAPGERLALQEVLTKQLQAGLEGDGDDFETVEGSVVADVPQDG